MKGHVVYFEETRYLEETKREGELMKDQVGSSRGYGGV